MNLKIHLVASLVLASTCHLLSGNVQSSILILFGALFPDVDHYLYFCYKFRNWNFIQAYKWVEAESKKPHPGPFEFIFHTLEYAVTLGILALLLNRLIFVLLGSIAHIFLDLTEDLTHYHSYTRYYVLSIKKPFKRKF
ncbi:hypothetical protein KEJ26_07235 [Candidatus Bathyarchaeota archaeon]|nr:hypothetical protein [Candidatus Bathyarchaeota archaeon]